MNDRVKAYTKQVEQVMNTVILGDKEGPAQWVCPMDDNDKTVGVICLDNNRIQKVIDELEKLINLSLTNEEWMDQWKACIPHYRDAVVILRQRKEYRDEDVVKYQTNIGEWFQVWMKLHGKVTLTTSIPFLLPT